VLPLVCVALMLGIFAGDLVPLPLAGGAVLAVVALVGWVCARRREAFVGVATLGLAFAAGALGQAVRARPPPGLLGDERQIVEGTVAAPPERAFGITRVLVDLDAVTRGDRQRAAEGRVAVSLAGEPWELLLPGDRVRFPSLLRPPRGFLVPGAPDVARRAAAEGVMATGSVHDPPALARMRAPPAWSLRRAPEAARERLRAALRAHLQGEDLALVSSLVLGDRGDVDRGLDDSFRAMGVSHVLSVSGLHLAVAAWLFYAGLGWLLLRVPGVGRGRPVRRLAALLALPATVAYTLLTGAQVATVRACVVAVVWFVGVALERRSTATQTLAIAALAVLIASPLELFDPSFQLSFAAALAGALLARRLLPRVALGGAEPPSEPLVAKGRARLPTVERWLARLGRWALRLCAASAAAILATAPIAAWHFAQFAPAGLLSNLVVVPLTELAIVPGGLLAAVAAAWHLPGSGLAVQLVGFLAHLTAVFVRAGAALVPSWHVPAPTVLELGAWYAGLLAVALGVRRARRIALAAVLVVAASLGARTLLQARSSSLTATFLDVGQGDGCVVELPRGHVVVIDGGGSFDPDFDPGRQVIAPFLHRRGIRGIDLIVLSHPHPDHANGLASLLDELPVGAVWTNAPGSSQPGTARLVAAARAHRVPVEAPHEVTLGGARLSPLAGVAADPALGDNDNSIVLAIEHAGRRLLFAGDLERVGEAALVDSHPLRADVVKVPHHGSKTSSTAPFVEALRPSLAVISVGERNRWRFPDPGVVARWRAVGARVLRTDVDGSITVRVAADGALSTRTVR
jgi:competence protein ComEC